MRDYRYRPRHNWRLELYAWAGPAGYLAMIAAFVWLLLSIPEYNMTDRSDGSTASYYELPEGATELEELILYRDMNHQVGTIFSSCYRYGEVEHSDQLREAKKLLFYSLAEVARVMKQDHGFEPHFPTMFKAMRQILNEAKRPNRQAKIGRPLEVPNN